MKILVVEDNQKLAQILKRGLETEFYLVDVSNDGEQALDYADSDQYDLLILDWMTPGKTGLEICQAIRKQGKQTPVLFLTARDTTADKVEGLDAGADDYLVKPFEFDELLARVRSLLRRHSDKSPLLKVDSLRLNPVKKLVTRKGHVINLTGTEYSLLEYLMRNQDHIVSSTQILDHVWDQSYDGLSNIVQTFVKQLRQKIDRSFPAEKPLLQTIRGLGYKLGQVSK